MTTPAAGERHGLLIPYLVPLYREPINVSGEKSWRDGRRSVGGRREGSRDTKDYAYTYLLLGSKIP